MLPVSSIYNFQVKIPTYESEFRAFESFSHQLKEKKIVSLQEASSLVQIFSKTLDRAKEYQLLKAELDSLKSQFLPKEGVSDIESLASSYSYVYELSKKVEAAAEVCLENFSNIEQSLLAFSRFHVPTNPFISCPLSKPIRMVASMVMQNGRSTLSEIEEETLGYGASGAISKVSLSFIKDSLAKKVYLPTAPQLAKSLNPYMYSIRSKNILYPLIARGGSLYFELGKRPFIRYFQSSNRFANLKKHIDDIVQGILDLQKFNLVHRDLKPENIIIMDDDTAKICDLDFLTLEGDMKPLAGTIGFIDPELAVDPKVPKRVSHKSDMWSLGITIFIMISGKKDILETDEKTAVSYFAKLRDDIIFGQSYYDQLIDEIPPEIFIEIAKNDIRRVCFEGCRNELILNGKAHFEQSLTKKEFDARFSLLSEKQKERVFLSFSIDQMARELQESSKTVNQFFFEAGALARKIPQDRTPSDVLRREASTIEKRYKLLLKGLLKKMGSQRLDIRAVYRWFIASKAIEAEKQAIILQKIYRGFSVRKKNRLSL